MSAAVALRRGARRALGALGLDVQRAGSGAVVLARAGRGQARRLGPSAVLAADRAGLREHWWPVEAALADVAAHAHVAALLAQYDVDCVLDVGANRGQFGRRLREAGFRGRIVSFEPVPATAAELRERAAPDPDWVVHACALGAQDGTTTMHVVPGTLSSVRAPTAFGARRYRRLRDPQPVEVPVRRLDGLLDEALAGLAARRPYLKLDTQGYDLEVFAGLGDRTADLVGLQSEVALLRIYDGMPRLPEALATYEAAGFEVTGLFPVSRESRTARVLEFDCVMARAGAG